LNILIDHNPEQFCAMISEFVQQIPEVDYLNLFITGFKEEDVTKTMYNTSSRTSHSLYFEGNKLNRICDLIQNTLEETKNPSYNPSILTADSKKNPPALEKAMLRISSIKANQSAKDAETALKYLIFLVDVNSLYDVALGIYDFPLVLMVAQHSNKDPREYLPFLAELKKLDSTYQKFKIDSHLGKYAKALGHLSQCKDRDDEFLNFMDKHQLYSRAMELFDLKSKMHTEILIRFANFQKNSNIYDQAAMLFEMAGKVEDAVFCYCEALLYREAIAICIRNEIDYTTQVQEMIPHLIEARRFKDAATIHIDFLQEPTLGIEVLVKGGHWDEAILIAQKNRLPDVLKSIILPNMVQYSQIFVSDVNEARDAFEKQALRLRQVRIEKTIARGN
jgi:elongator complex protein 1